MSAAAAIESQPLQAYLDGNRFDAIERLSVRAESYAVSVSEAAFRSDGKECWVLLGKLGLTVVEALKLAEAIGKDADADQ
jgi:hypothetical protein